MTKKPSEKNKAWEKDRRDRLNKSFEELAKLLPKYDPSITWSKIEIIQKSISHIKELHERHEDYLRDKNPEILKEHNDLIDALNCYQARNGQLSDLLKKAKITLPVFKLPKFLIDNPQYYLKNGQHIKFSSTNEIKIKSIGRPGKYINKTATEINSTTAAENDITTAIATVSNSSDQITLQQQDNHELNDSTQVTDEKQNLQQNTETLQISTESEVKQEHSVVQNEAILTTGILVPLVPLKPIESIQQTTTNLLTIPVPIQNVAEIPLTTPISITTSSSYKSKSFIKLSSSTSTSQRLLHQIQQNSIKKIYRKFARDKDGRIKILPQPRLKVYFQRSDGKVPIPVLKKYGNGNVPLKRKRRRKRKASVTIAERIIETAKENSENNMKKRKLEENDNEKEEKKDILLKAEDLPEFEIVDKTKVVQNVGEKNTSEEENKKSDLNINQNENDNTENSSQKSSNGSVSPTAAFLQSFPVVTTTTTTTITAIEPINQNDSIEKCDSTENKNNMNVLDKLSNNEITDESLTKNIICYNDPIQINKIDMDFEIEKTVSQTSIKEENIQNSIKQGLHQDLSEALEVLQTQTTENERNVIIPQLSSSLTLPIPVTTKEFPIADLPCSSSSTVISARRNSFSSYKQMPICTPLPLPTPINITNNTPVSIPSTSIPSTISNINSVNPHEPLPVTVPNLNPMSTTTVSIFPSVTVSSHSTNFSCSIVETTWCSLNTIPTTDIIQKDDKILNSQHLSNLGLQNENIFVPPTTITQNISSFSSCSQPVTKNSNSINVDNNLINVSNQLNPPQLQTVGPEQNSNLIFPKITSSPSLTFNTPPLTTTIATTTSSKKRQNSRKSNKAKQQTNPLPILATPPLPIQNLSVCSSNTLQKNTTVCVTSPSTTSSPSFSSSSSISASPLPKNQQQIYSTFPGPEISSVSNSYSQNFTNSYSNFPPPISHSPSTTLASQFQSYSNNQSMKYTSSMENTVIPLSSNDTRQKSDNNTMCVPQFKTPQPKAEIITSISHQSKHGNFIYNPSQIKYGNVNHVLQSKTGGIIIPHHSSELQKSVSSAIIENLNTPSMPPRVQTPAPGFSQSNKSPIVTTYPQSIVNKHYHHAPPPSNTGEFVPLPSVSSGYQHSSTTMSLPSNRSSAYPIVASNSSELNLSPHCTNTYSRTTISNNLPIYPLANNTTTSSFLFPSTYIQMPPGTMTNQLHTYPPANIISTTFVATATTSSLVYTTQQSRSHSKDSVLPLHYPNVPYSVNVCTASSSTNNDFPLRQTTVTTPSTTSSLYLSYPPTPTSNVVFSTISSTPSLSIHSSPSKQSQKTIPTNIQSQNTKDNLSLTPSTSVTTSYVTGTNTSKQTSSFKSYQPVVAHANPIKSYTSQQSSTLSAPDTTSSSIPPPPMQCTMSNSQNNLILNSTSSNYTQNFSTNSNTVSSPSTSFAPPKTKMTNSIPKTTSNITPICPSITPSLYSNYPPPSLTPLPPPLLSTVIPTPNTSFSSFPQNVGVSAFLEPMETLKYPVTSSVAPIQNYNKTSNLQSSLTFVNKSVDSFISAVSPNPVYTNTSQASSNPNYSVSNTFGPPNSDSLYSPVKNYYYHPIQVQETPNFSFSLTSSANTPPIVSPNPPPHMLPPSVKPDSLPWMPHPPPPTSINANNYKSSFTFSLTPSTTTVYNSIANSPTTSSLTNRSFTNTTSTQKASSTKSTLPSKAKGNYNNSIVPKSQSSAVTTTTVATSYATNFTFSLTQSKNSLTNSENCRNVKSNTLNDYPPPPQQQQQQIPYDHYNVTPDLQNKRNLSATNFSFALTKTTSSNNVISNRIAAQQTISNTTTTLTTTNSTPSFSIDTTLNQPSSNLCGTQNMNNVKSTPTVTEAEQIQRSSSNVFKKPIIESLPNKESSSSSSTSSSSSQNQNYYTYDQKLQKSSSSTSSSLNQQRIPVNWMAPPPPPSTDYGAPSLVDYGCLTNYHSTATSVSQPPQNFDYNTRKSDIYYPPFPSTDENFSSWSPNKMLDTATSHLVNTSSMNLGNYYGGEIPSFSGSSGSGTNIPVSSVQTPQNSNKSSYSTTNNNSGDKTLSGNVKDFKDSNNGSSVSSNIQSSCNQNNFLSVSQLVDQESNISNIQKNYENCPNTNINSNKKIQSSSSSSSSSNKSKDTKKFNANITFPALGAEQGNNSTTPNTIPNSNNYSAEALLTKKDKNIRNYSNVCNTPDFYGTMNTPQTLYSSSSSSTTSLMPDPSIEPNYFYPNYATNTGTCLTDTDYLGSIYPNETNYSRSQSIKPVIRKISSTTSIPPPVTPQSHHHHHHHHPVSHHAPHPPSTNFVPYDANYYPVPLGVNSPLMPGPAPPPPPHHHTSDPYGAGPLTTAPAAYIHSSPKFHHQTPHSWTSKSTTATNPIHHQYNLQDQHLFSSTVNVSNNTGTSSNNGSQQNAHNNSNSSGTTTSGGSGANSSGGGGNNLTNFNLTTICPEINNEKVGSNPW